MSDADRSRYAEEVTQLSEQELQRILDIVSPPVCLLGGWAVHLHVTDAFQAEHGRPYIGSRDIDLGVRVDPSWNSDTLQSKPVATTLDAIESEMAYNRGRFGFYQYFHRISKERLSDDDAADHPQHEIFRVDIDVLPSTTEVDAFVEAFGFRPPAEPLLDVVFSGESETLDEFVDWDAPAGVSLAPRAALAAMKIRAFPERDKSHKRLKDLADLHALLWYGSSFDQLRQRVVTHLSQEDSSRFADAITDEAFVNASRLIGVDEGVLRNSIQQTTV